MIVTEMKEIAERAVADHEKIKKMRRGEINNESEGI